jgi:hypothetical protein
VAGLQEPRQEDQRGVAADQGSEAGGHPRLFDRGDRGAETVPKACGSLIGELAPWLVSGPPAKVAAETTPAGEIVLDQEGSAVRMKLCVYADQTSACEGLTELGSASQLFLLRSAQDRRPRRQPARRTDTGDDVIRLRSLVLWICRIGSPGGHAKAATGP